MTTREEQKEQLITAAKTCFENYADHANKSYFLDHSSHERISLRPAVTDFLLEDTDVTNFKNHVRNDSEKIDVSTLCELLEKAHISVEKLFTTKNAINPPSQMTYNTFLIEKYDYLLAEGLLGEAESETVFHELNDYLSDCSATLEEAYGPNIINVAEAAKPQSKLAYFLSEHLTSTRNLSRHSISLGLDIVGMIESLAAIRNPDTKYERPALPEILQSYLEPETLSSPTPNTPTLEAKKNVTPMRRHIEIDHTETSDYITRQYGNFITSIQYSNPICDWDAIKTEINYEETVKAYKQDIIDYQQSPSPEKALKCMDNLIDATTRIFNMYDDSLDISEYRPDDTFENRRLALKNKITLNKPQQYNSTLHSVPNSNVVAINTATTSPTSSKTP